MDFKSLVRTILQSRVKTWLLIALPLMLSACASNSTVPVENEVESDVIETTPVDNDNVEQGTITAEEVVEVEKTPVPVEQKPLSAEVMYYILTAEVAGQRGEMGIAVDLYAKAAETLNSTTLAERSARVAAFTRDQQRVQRALKRWVEVDPDNPDAYIMQAPLLIVQNDFDELRKVVDKALAIDPDNASSYMDSLYDGLRAAKDTHKAAEVIPQLSAYKAGNIETFYTAARMAMGNKDYALALKEVDKVLVVDAQREDAIILKSDALQRSGKGDAALALLAKQMKQESVTDSMRFAYARSLGENDRAIEAKVIFEELYQSDPKNNEVTYALGLIALEQKEGEKAKQYFTELLKRGDPGKQSAYFLGLAEELNENVDKALMWYASVPRNSGRFDSAQAQYVTLLGEQGQIDKARNHLKLLRKEIPNRSVEFYLYEGAFLYENDMGEATFELYTEALKEHPGDVELLYARAMMAEPLDRLDVLEKDLRLILQQQPSNAQALNALGYTLTDRTDRHQEALALIQKAVDISPKDPYYLDSLGWVYYRLGDLDKAEQYLREAIEIQADVEFMAHLGEVLWEQGEQADAKKVWKRALKQNEDNKLLIKTMKRYGQ